ncbi:hypothetical protein BUALT_Bualt07G0158100 [Buddleja alternifolia]|uniref:Protein kinase domain-containing protein n=1 Tax=Buddleja alternifolia TaxID=168488 RepID=A0AAV6XAH5_9LAMI|nr:hypothetical protein BUALT_Bualt07G0158100 [Buddleja alternifolia]
MELKLRFVLVEFCLILRALFLQESAGLDVSSFSVASLFHPIKVTTHDLRLYGGLKRLLLPKNDVAISPTSTHTGAEHKHGAFAAAPHLKPFHAQSPLYHSSIRPHKKHHFPKKFHHIAPQPHHRPPKGLANVPSPSPAPLSDGWTSMRPLPLPAIPFHHFNVPSPSPTISPTSSSIGSNKKILPPLPSLALPPPPPHKGCESLKCTEPLTYTPPGATCGCVWPIEVRLSFSTSLYTFFPLVSELAEEIAAAIPLDRSQVRIMGADAADQQLENTTVLINLVPLEDKFDAVDAFLIYTKFWKRAVSIKTSVFGDYEVLYVHYPGLPPSPPSRHSNSATIDAQPYPGSRNDDGPLKPLGVDVPRRRKNDSSKNMVIIIVLSSVTAFVVCMGFILLFLSKCGCFSSLYRQSQQDLISSNGKPSGGGRLLTLRSRPSSASMSFGSSLMAYTGTAKVFTLDDIERATDNFNSTRILGEGGFGLVYGGVLDDGRNVAVKVLKRDDQQGGREFLAEVEMLSRLHHRNLVKLIGICAEDHCRCLVYELVPNGSVESHLHGADKEIAPLDWTARMKIALENLVSWARPLLTTNEGLEIIIDPSLKPSTPLDNFSKVVAIASMCVQPEVSHRPFMGEVVQALKLVCNEFEETVSRSCSQEDIYMDLESKHKRIENELMEDLEKGESSFDDKTIALSAVDLKSSSAGFDVQESESYRRQFNSVPLKMGRKRKFWQRLRGLSRGSMSDHEYL